MLQPLSRLVALVAFWSGLQGCGHDGAKPHKDDAAIAKPAVVAMAMPPLGVDRIARFNFPYNEGGAAYAKALAAYKAKTRDWTGVRDNCEAAVAKDPAHLDAQYLLGVALGQAGDPAAADHLALAIAGDYYAYGPAFGTNEDLAAFRKTPQGLSLGDLAQRVHDEYVKRIQSGLWLVGRRAAFKWPAKDGVQPGTSRGELYAYDRELKRYLRLTHTDHQVAGFVRAPNSGEVALIGFDKVEHDGADKPPLLARTWLLAIDPGEWKPLGPRVVIPSARTVAVGYGDGDDLVASAAQPTGRWTIAEWTTWSIDRTTGKLARVAHPPPAPRVELTLDEGRVVHAAAIPGVDAAWTGDPATAPSLKVGATTIAVPESGQAAHDSVAVSADRANVAFATAVDPCGKDVLPSLYVADGKTGALRHVLTAKSRFATRWLDNTTLAYDDGDGGIRLWNAATGRDGGRELERLENKAGLALDALSLAAGTCKQPPIETAGSGDELPPRNWRLRLSAVK